jgi:multidrug efflux system outer membrane protein
MRVPAAPVPQSWPAGDAYLRESEAVLPEVSYRDVFRDPRLQSLIGDALANNRNVRIAAANLAAARARRGSRPLGAISRNRGWRLGELPGARWRGQRELCATGRGGELRARPVRASRQRHRGRAGSCAGHRGVGAHRAARPRRRRANAWATYGGRAGTSSPLPRRPPPMPAAQSRADASAPAGGIAPRTDVRQAEQGARDRRRATTSPR